MVNNAKKSAAKASAYGYFESIDTNNGFADAEVAGYTKIADGEYNVSEISVRMKGESPSSGEVTIEKGKELKLSTQTMDYSETLKINWK